ncbi:MAG: DUF348 domain-containing protein [Cellulomonadaceae bacterium]|nr:DUF348 domain-containing protein [Cellulomonadaceae bacterium]
MAGGSLAVARAHKTVTLDVDGERVSISTFAGTISGVLESQGLQLAAHDTVAPDPSTGLRDGDEIVVRSGHPVTVLSGGQEQTVWTTALSADEALTSLSARGDDVRLVASRSSAGRADLAMRLDLDGGVDVQVDGGTQHVEDGAVSLDALLASIDVTVGAADRVQVVRSAAGSGAALTVVVQRVVVQATTTVSEIPFETVTEQSADLYKGQSRTSVAGVAGERTLIEQIVTVDGAEESRTPLSDVVTRAPVTAVVQQGTKARPVAVASGGSSVGGDVWAALARCESGGNPLSVSSSGAYYGLYQFSLSTWRAMGGSGLPTEASAEEQTQRAQALQARSGWGQWPACARSLGLL